MPPERSSRSRATSTRSSASGSRCACSSRASAALGRGDDKVGNPHRAQISQFELFELILSLKLDKQFPVEQVEATVSQSTVPSPPLRCAGGLGVLAGEDAGPPGRAHRADAGAEEVFTAQKHDDAVCSKFCLPLEQKNFRSCCS